MLVEAAFASRAPGPPRAFHRRVKDRRGFHVATVAAARKMAVLCWHLIDKARTTPSPADPQRPQAQARARRRDLTPADRTARPVTTTSSSSEIRNALVEHAE